MKTEVTASLARRLLVAACILGLLPPVATADGGSSAGSEPGRLTLTPAPPPDPALSILLRPDVTELRGEDASAAYLAAGLALPEELTNAADELSSLSVDELRAAVASGDERVSSVRSFEETIESIARAARHRRCIWDWDLSQGIELVLPHLGTMRSMARVVSVHARLAIIEDDPAEAMHHIRTLFAMARHVAEGPTLIEGLVGAAIAGLGVDVVADLMQREDSPNLYWALTELGTPVIDLGDALRTERSLLYLWNDELDEARDADWTDTQWQVMLPKLIERVVPGSRDSGRAQLMIATISMVTYPRGKQWLIERGADPEDVEAMHPAEVTLRFLIYNFESSRDELFKWTELPYWQARDGVRNAEAALEARDGPGNMLAETLLPAVSSVLRGQAQLDRRVAALRVVEAVRAHVAATGTPPATLQDIEKTPVPIDPMTGERFEYQATGAGVRIASPRFEGERERDRVEYLVRFRAPDKE